MTGVFGYRIQYGDGMVVYTPFISSLVGAVEVEPVVFTTKSPFCIDDNNPAVLVVRRENSPPDVYWPLTQAIQLGIASTSKEWTREVSAIQG